MEVQGRPSQLCTGLAGTQDSRPSVFLEAGGRSQGFGGRGEQCKPEAIWMEEVRTSEPWSWNKQPRGTCLRPGPFQLARRVPPVVPSAHLSACLPAFPDPRLATLGPPPSATARPHPLAQSRGAPSISCKQDIPMAKFLPKSLCRPLWVASRQPGNERSREAGSDPALP